MFTTNSFHHVSRVVVRRVCSFFTPRRGALRRITPMYWWIGPIANTLGKKPLNDWTETQYPLPLFQAENGMRGSPFS